MSKKFQRSDNKHPTFQEIVKKEEKKAEKEVRVTFQTTEEIAKKVKLFCIENNLTLKQFFNDLIEKNLK